MFKNYSKVAFRNLARHKLFSFINIGILTFSFLGMIVLSLVTIGSRIYKVAIANPVHALRAE